MSASVSDIRAGTFSEIIGNTALINIELSGQVQESGVGLFLGRFDDSALLLVPAHLLVRGQELGNPQSEYVIQARINNAMLRFRYADSRHFLIDPLLTQAHDSDYAIVEVPLSFDEKAIFYSLNDNHFSKPTSNQTISIFGEAPGGGYDMNFGQLSKITRQDVITFTVKTNYAVQKGESGSVIIGNDDRVVGILIESDQSGGVGLYPEPGLREALERIKWADSNRTDVHGMSFSIVPTYQFSRQTYDLGGGLTQTDSDDDVYTSFEIKYSLLSQPGGSTSSMQYSLIGGFSPGAGHGLGQVAEADYTFKYGIFLGAMDRLNDNTGGVSLFVLSHRVDDEFEHRVGMAIDVALTQLIKGEKSALDLGFRLEVNQLSGFSDNGNVSFGLGLIMEYSWFDIL